MLELGEITKTNSRQKIETRRRERERESEKDIWLCLMRVLARKKGGKRYTDEKDKRESNTESCLFRKIKLVMHLAFTQTSF